MYGKGWATLRGGRELACAEAFIPLIAALVAAGGSVANTEISAGKQAKLQKTALDAQKAAADKASADAAALANKPKELTPEVSAAMRAKIASLQQQGGGGLSPDFYTSALNASFPEFTGMTSDVVKKTLAGG